MSQTTSQDKTTPITAAPAPAPEQPAAEEKKPSFVAKTKRFVVKHKKVAYAGAALVSLTAIAAVTGRKTAPLPDFSQQPRELEAGEVTVEIVPETESDTHVA
jgi:hypothetical protein